MHLKLIDFGEAKKYDPSAQPINNPDADDDNGFMMPEDEG